MNENDRKKTAKHILFAVFLFLFGYGTTSAITRYVTETGSGLKDGSSWANASDDPQAMINLSMVDDEVWVAQGTYLPRHNANGWTESEPTGLNNNPNDQNNAFVLKTGVKIYGGFAGDETDISQRNWIKYRTTLSGDFERNDYGNDASHANSSENAYHVVITINTGAGTLLDGFTICGGNRADGVGSSFSISVNGFPSVGNKQGGGIYAYNSKATLQNLEIRRNGAYDGGGIFCLESPDLRGYNLYFFKNFAAQGGGMYVRNSPKFKNIILSENESGVGAAISNVGTATEITEPNYINIVIHSNYGSPHNGQGAGVHNQNASPVFTNATIVGNFGGLRAAGVYSSGSSYPVFNNSIIWNNKAAEGTAWAWTNVRVFNVENLGGEDKYYNTLLQGADLTATGGLDATSPDFDPMFINPPGYSHYDGLGSFTLKEGSPCIDTGNQQLYIDACGSEFQDWDNEFTVTPPPFMDASADFFGGCGGCGGESWYPKDEYSGKILPRLGGEGINIGAFEEILLEPDPKPEPCTEPGIIRYVTKEGKGSKDGSSWENASDDLQEMINISDICDEVWVAAGTYIPTHSADG
ncbi:MAG: hypothetical protein LUG18_04580 [Candidatus Azobacteroides sp.]|nr:hypothetical protein [Candidatus Azobacteroides sp.]